MWKLYHNITTIVLLNEYSPKIWLTLVIIILSKDKGKPEIYQIRIIKKYESEYNLILKYFWPKLKIQKAEENI